MYVSAARKGACDERRKKALSRWGSRVIGTRGGRGWNEKRDRRVLAKKKQTVVDSEAYLLQTSQLSRPEKRGGGSINLVGKTELASNLQWRIRQSHIQGGSSCFKFSIEKEFKLKSLSLHSQQS